MQRRGRAIVDRRIPDMYTRGSHLDRARARKPEQRVEHEVRTREFAHRA